MIVFLERGSHSDAYWRSLLDYTESHFRRAYAYRSSLSGKHNEEKDDVIYCENCGNSFLFTVSQKRYYRRKHITHPPRYCEKCRMIRKRQVLFDDEIEDILDIDYAPPEDHWY